MSKTIRLYHFVNDEFGLENIKERRLKLAFPDSVNDLFELRPFDFGKGRKGRKLRNAWGQSIREFSKSTGFISFSESWSVPTMWAHYADNHKGICVGFDLATELGDKIEYIDKLIEMDECALTDTEYNQKMQDIAKRTKSIHWAYEQEWRYWFLLDDTEKQKKLDNPSTISFVDFDNKLVLREVIIGARSKCSTKNIQDLLKPSDDVVFITARPSFRNFAMVPQNLKSKQK
ncbi:MAG: DUF2971 domain-containing protein [Lentilitoribacter sp.]